MALSACDNPHAFERIGYPTSSRYFDADTADSHPYCEAPRKAAARQDYYLFTHLTEPQLGSTLEASDIPEAKAEQWVNLGYRRVGDTAWKKVADMASARPMENFDLPELPTVDCIAISSVDRHNGARPYIYDTLQELFREFPQGVRINVVVGNNDVDYLTPERLMGAGIAAKDLHKIVVHPADGPTSHASAIGLPKADTHAGAFLLHDYATSPGIAVRVHERRASWNCARGLLNYTGHKGLLFFEDDVLLTENGMAHFARAHQAAPMPVVSLFNRYCGESARAPKLSGTDVGLFNPKVGDLSYYCAQGMYFAPEVTQELARYILLRMHTLGHDQLANHFFVMHKMHVGYPYPSLVQHVGRRSSVLTDWFPESRCFAYKLSPLL